MLLASLFVSNGYMQQKKGEDVIYLKDNGDMSEAERWS